MSRSRHHATWAREWARKRQAAGLCTNCQSSTDINPRTGHHYWHCRTCRIARTVFYRVRRDNGLDIEGAQS